MPPPTNIEALKLTDKQRRFCEEYVIDWNAKRAAIAAGYSEKTAQQIGAENLTKPVLQEYIQHRRENLAEACGISAQWIAQHYKNQVLAGVEHVFTDWLSREAWENVPPHVKSAVKKMETKRDSYDLDGQKIYTEWVKVEFYDKQAALKALRDMLGTDAAVKTQSEITGKGGGPINLQVQVVRTAPPVTSEDEIDESIEP